ncbi:SEC-C metal-binding domain-containing protein [Vibrio amylolyticus]|uniref:SEC-C metal-binding domain-containing protein n=1 Tax=Vibrio amylolyticus TaxID=2847292 RepID=UPI003553A91E
METEEKILARKLQKEEGILKKAKTGFNRPNWLKAIKKSTLKESSKNYKNVKPKRNEPCACGSGKKYKKCCMPA